MLEQPRESSPARKAAGAAETARTVADETRLQELLRHLAWSCGAREEPAEQERTAWTWWDTAGGRLHRKGAQLVVRCVDGEQEFVRWHDRKGSREIDVATMRQWMFRDRALLPITRMIAERRTWHFGHRGSLEWVRWELPGNGRRDAVRIAGDDRSLRSWWDDLIATRVLGGVAPLPSWTDHAVLAAEDWLLGPASAASAPGVQAQAARASADRLAVAIPLHAELLIEDLPSASPVAETIEGARAAVNDCGAFALLPSHPVWRPALRRALDERADARSSLLNALAFRLRYLSRATGKRSMPRVAAATTLRGCALALRAASPWIDAPVEKSTKRLLAPVELLERRQRLLALNSLLQQLADETQLSPDVFLEFEVRRRRIRRELRRVDRELAPQLPIRLPKPIRRWARATIDETLPPLDTMHEVDSKGDR